MFYFKPFFIFIKTIFKNNHVKTVKKQLKNVFVLKNIRKQFFFIIKHIFLIFLF